MRRTPAKVAPHLTSKAIFVCTKMPLCLAFIYDEGHLVAGAENFLCGCPHENRPSNNDALGRNAAHYAPTS